MHLLGDITVDEFLRDYWHKKPLLIRNAWPDFEPLLGADELAGLSLEQEIESRIVMENGPDGPWSIRKGPFSEADYGGLPEEKWTLLVQAVDHWIPEASDLLQHFSFLPGWRIDDLMISYAVDGGSVGPHSDQYDVFLLQAEGQREWRIGQMCTEQTPILQGPKIRILDSFEETDRWVLNPGDMLYLPPQLAHWGISRGECQTYSIGFRAPSVAELGQSLLDQLLRTASEDQRYADPDLTSDEGNGEISIKAKQRLKALLTEQLLTDEMLSDTLGRLMTEGKYPELQAEKFTESDWDNWRSQQPQLPVLRKAEHARFAYATQPDQTLVFYAQGLRWELSSDDRTLAEALCKESDYPEGFFSQIECTEPGYELIKALWLHQLITELAGDDLNGEL